MCLTAGFCLLLPMMATATMILGVHDWDDGTNVVEEGWSSMYGWSQVTDPQSPGGNPQGWLEIKFTNIVEDPPGPWWADVVSTPATNLFAGTWTTNMWVTFDFLADTVEPFALQVRWGSTNSSKQWRYNLDAPDVGDWTTYSASLLDWDDWDYAGGTEAQYLADLGSIDWIGIYIFRTGAGEQIYGIDNFMLMIPEPTQCMMLGVVGLVSLWSRRRKKKPPG
jgi:hypothetical protein